MCGQRPDDFQPLNFKELFLQLGSTSPREKIIVSYEIFPDNFSEKNQGRSRILFQASPEAKIIKLGPAGKLEETYSFDENIARLLQILLPRKINNSQRQIILSPYQLHDLFYGLDSGWSAEETLQSIYTMVDSINAALGFVLIDFILNQQSFEFGWCLNATVTLATPLR